MNFWIRLFDSWYDTHTYAKKRAELDNFEVWKNFRPPHIIESNWERYLSSRCWRVLEGVQRVGPRIETRRLKVLLASI